MTVFTDFDQINAAFEYIRDLLQNLKKSCVILCSKVCSKRLYYYFITLHIDTKFPYYLCLYVRFNYILTQTHYLKVHYYPYLFFFNIKWLCSAVCYLGEESPPLPVSELQVRSTVPLHHTQSAELLLLLMKRPERTGQLISMHTHYIPPTYPKHTHTHTLEPCKPVGTRRGLTRCVHSGPGSGRFFFLTDRARIGLGFI